MSRKITTEEYHNLADKHGIKWLGTQPPPSTRHKTTWLCPKGHTWEGRYNDIQSGHSCPFCGDMLPKTAQDYHDLAALRGFEWLGSTAPGNRNKTLWRCSNGHEWQTDYGSIKRGRGCPYCSGVVKKTADDYRAIAEKFSLEWLETTIPRNSKTKTKWRCPNGHVWDSTFHDISQGYGCARCAGVAPKTEADYHALAKSKGFKWFGGEAVGNKTKTTWQCINGHQFEATYNVISRGGICPDCDPLRINGHYVSTQQMALHKMTGGQLNFKVKKYSIDIVLDIEGVKIGIEYDSFFWHGQYAERDKNRIDFLCSLGWRILCIKSGRLLPSHEQLWSAIRRLLAGDTYIEIVLRDWKGD